MNRRSILGFLLVAVLSLLHVERLFAADITDKKIHGTYVGLNPILVSQGASYEESLVRFSIGNNGIVLSENLLVGGTPFEFKVNFTRDWITAPVKGWGVDDGIAIRQHLNSKLAQLIFFFPPRVKDGFDAAMILGEGIPAPLGVFVREEKGEARLQKFYKDEYKPKVSEEPIAWLIPIDMANALKIMRFGIPEQKVKILKDVEHNLWTGTEQEIVERLSLVAIGINDADPNVQVRALRTFGLGGRVTGGVSLVVGALSRYRVLDSRVLDEAVDAAVYLLYETYNHNITVAAVQNSFGTTDVRKVHDLSGGLVTPEQFEALKKIVNLPASRKWTIEQQTALRNAIQAVVADKSVSEKTRQRGAKALADYPLPEVRVRGIKRSLENQSP